MKNQKLRTEPPWGMAGKWRTDICTEVGSGQPGDIKYLGVGMRAVVESLGLENGLVEST